MVTGFLTQDPIPTTLYIIIWPKYFEGYNYHGFMALSISVINISKDSIKL